MALDPMHDWKLLAGYGNNSVQGAGGSGYTGNQLTGFSDKLLASNLTTDAPWTPSVPTPDPSASGLGKYLNKDFLGGVGSAMEGLGSLAQGWAALKNLKLSRQAMENQQNQWQTNFDAQALATNNQIANQNAWKKAQGRTDYGAYVGGKPAGSNYVG